jgi:hypothetical protein
MKKGEQAFFFHTAIVGIVRVIAEAHPDSTGPIWRAVDVAAVRQLQLLRRTGRLSPSSYSELSFRDLRFTWPTDCAMLDAPVGILEPCGQRSKMRPSVCETISAILALSSAETSST